ncbi:hypothetical protein BO83DRAFT_403584 [Aspergillus eucalypticola CBS 122712]|uniref:Uncharacterized protein n=1 Tax=Aspergillus eucalypticola (strain CBS 122712 / IBT 29274) TaxID=1448314 RepID=A0A317ULT2_ASPEC|nr:uncharacterized protein BO83DRAFT_403584 [Aspergillus eucalypticola CBS 122712]PWY62844.1 hypothetical protein BO83DRAFT_403584 [Aspergillus eucalypticola CBS 122712]
MADAVAVNEMMQGPGLNRMIQRQTRREVPDPKHLPDRDWRNMNRPYRLNRCYTELTVTRRSLPSGQWVVLTARQQQQHRHT